MIIAALHHHNLDRPTERFDGTIKMSDRDDIIRRMY